MSMTRVAILALLTASAALAQSPTDPFPTPIPATEGVIRVRLVEFASIPDVGGEAARMMLLVDEPGTRRMFVNDMRGPLYTVSYDGRSVARYLDINAPNWGVSVQSSGRERGFQSFAIHPQFNQPGTPGFGKLYVWTDTTNNTLKPDFAPGGGSNTHATVLLEWTARTPAAAAYDGGPPRELLRLEQPFANHNGGHMSFNPLAAPGSADFGLLYVGVADGGSGGDPLGVAQNLSSPFGKILRIDPLGSNSANRKYGIPAGNPFVGKAGALGEIYAYGVRNPQRFGWDPRNGNLFVADIGQDIVEELSVARAGANLGWNKWEGSFGFISRQAVSLTNRRADASVTYPVAEYGQLDPLLQTQSAITGVHVYRNTAIPQLANLVLFGDFPSGEIFYIQADKLPPGGQDPIRRILLNDGGESKTFLKVIQEKNVKQGKPPTTRADLRFGAGPNGQVFLLNKHDGTIRLLVGDATAGAASAEVATWKVAGDTREAIVYGPPAGRGSGKVPLVLSFHGRGDDMQNFQYTNLHVAWPDAIVVYFQGLSTRDGLAGWQVERGQDNDRDLKLVDVALVALRQKYNVDDDRVYATGFSNGAAFTYLLWAERPAVFAAYAAVAGRIRPSVQLQRPRPLLHIGGERDPQIPIADQKAAIVAAIGANGVRDKTTRCGDGCTIYGSGTPAPVMTWIHSGGHIYPRGTPERIASFFHDHPRTR